MGRGVWGVKILVFGAGGQLGQSLRLVAPRFAVELVGLTHHECDIANPEAVHDTIQQAKPDWVINAAAYTAVDKAEDEPLQAYAVNARGAENIARACRDLDHPLIHVSTDYVFDGSKQTAYKPDDPVRPLSVYGASKLAGEIAVRVLAPRHFIVRTSWVFSPFGKNFVKTILRLAEARDRLSVVADQVGRPTYAPDLAVALIQLATKAMTQPWCSAVLHFANATETNWCEFAQTIIDTACTSGLSTSRVAVDPITTPEFPTKAVRPMRSVLDTLAVEQEWGIEPRPWRMALSECIALWRDTPGLLHS